jgi:glycosyltransferase involved in cell wall biosynthesis
MNPIPSSPFTVAPSPVLPLDESCPATVRMLVRPSVNDTAEDLAKPTPVPAFRVLHVVNGEHFSGAERVQSHLGRCLPAQGVTADFACVKPGRFADMLDSRCDLPTGENWGRGYRVKMRGRWDFVQSKRLADIVRKENYAILHAHTPRTAMLASAASRITGVPWVYHVHSPAARDSARPISNRINAWIERRSLANCAHIVCVSNSLREELIRTGHDAQRVSVVHNGVPAIRPERTARPVVGGPWVIGMIALMRNRKGLEVALDALARVRQHGYDVTLRCIGPFETDAYRKKIDRRVSDLEIGPHLDWVGFTQNVPSELARLDAMVLPSLFGEGLPMVVLEAMAAAVPVIATRVEGTPEAVRHGVEGLLAEPRDAESLAEQIESLVSGRYDWETMAEAAAARHGEHFSDITMARATANMYRKLL